MTRTPDEIKKGLECHSRLCGCDMGCPYVDVCAEDEGCPLSADAVTYIKQLEKSLSFARGLADGLKAATVKQEQEIYKLQAERDAAVADIRFAFTSYVGACQTCKHGENQVDCIEPIRCPDCENEKCKCQSCDGDFRNWEWRGVQKEG